MDTTDSPILQPRPSVQRIEAAAWKTLETCCRKLGLGDIPLPVPVEQWIENPLRFRFGIEDLSHLGQGVLGGAYIKERTIVVSDRLTHEGRFRFTCAHELGHQVLHRRRAVAFKDASVMRSGQIKTIEWQADRFAAAFLMPIPLVVRELFIVCKELNMSRDDISALMMAGPRSYTLWSKSFLPAIAARFGVSKAAAVYRFGEIQLADGNPFLLPEHRAGLLSLPPKRPPKPRNEPGLFQGI